MGTPISEQINQSKEKIRTDGFPKRLRDLMNQRGTTQVQLAAQLDVAQGRISEWLSGISLPQRKNAHAIAVHFGVSRHWLATGQEDQSPETDIRSDKLSATTALSDRVATLDPARLVPILSYAQGGQAIDFEVLPPEDQNLVPTLCRDPKAFGLILRGDSMEPYHRENSVIIVTPSTDLRYERLVVAQLTGVGVCFKVLNIPPAKGLVRLSSYNPVFSPIERPEEDFDWIWPVHSVIHYERL